MAPFFAVSLMICGLWFRQLLLWYLLFPLTDDAFFSWSAALIIAVYAVSIQIHFHFRVIPSAGSVRFANDHHGSVPAVKYNVRHQGKAVTAAYHPGMDVARDLRGCAVNVMSIVVGLSAAGASAASSSMTPESF